jgi:hypothetical protein
MDKSIKNQLIATKTNDIMLFEGTLGSRDVMAKCFPHYLEYRTIVEKEFYEHPKLFYVSIFTMINIRTLLVFTVFSNAMKVITFAR